MSHEPHPHEPRPHEPRPHEPRPSRPASGGEVESSTGLDPRLARTLCYLLGWLSGLVFLIVEKSDPEVRFHAYQSVATFGALFIVSVAAGAVPLIGGLISMLIAPVTVILWIVLMLKAWQGERFKLPIVGDWAEGQIAR